MYPFWIHRQTVRSDRDTFAATSASVMKVWRSAASMGECLFMTRRSHADSSNGFVTNHLVVVADRVRIKPIGNKFQTTLFCLVTDADEHRPRRGRPTVQVAIAAEVAEYQRQAGASGTPVTHAVAARRVAALRIERNRPVPRFAEFLAELEQRIGVGQLHRVCENPLPQLELHAQRISERRIVAGESRETAEKNTVGALGWFVSEWRSCFAAPYNLARSGGLRVSPGTADLARKMILGTPALPADCEVPCAICGDRWAPFFAECRGLDPCWDEGSGKPPRTAFIGFACPAHHVELNERHRGNLGLGPWPVS
jgi:hypothetical protein